jgi:hypothetical protein
MYDKQAGTFFGPSLKCLWNLTKDAEKGLDSSEEYYSNPESDDDFSLLTPGAESENYEMVPHEDLEGEVQSMGDDGTPQDPSKSVSIASRSRSSSNSSSLSLITDEKVRQAEQVQEQEEAVRSLCEEVVDRLSALPPIDQAEGGVTEKGSLEVPSEEEEKGSEQEEDGEKGNEVVLDMEEEALKSPPNSLAEEESVRAQLIPPPTVESLETAEERVTEENATAAGTCVDDPPDELIETEVKVPLSPTNCEDPAVPALARSFSAAGRPNLDTPVVPPTGNELQPDAVNQVLGGAFRAATTALDMAKTVLNQTSRTIQEAGRQIQQNQRNRQYRWEPPQEQWVPAAQAWIPQGTQTETEGGGAPGEATAWWTPPPAWNAPPEADVVREDPSGQMNTSQVGIETEGNDGHRNGPQESEVLIDFSEDPEPPAPPQPAPFNSQMNCLLSMGFNDVERNLELLVENEADVNRVVDTLLLDFQVVREREVPAREEYQFLGRFHGPDFD